MTTPAMPVNLDAVYKGDPTAIGNAIRYLYRFIPQPSGKQPGALLFYPYLASADKDIMLGPRYQLGLQQGVSIQGNDPCLLMTSDAGRLRWVMGTARDARDDSFIFGIDDTSGLGFSRALAIYYVSGTRFEIGPPLSSLANGLEFWLGGATEPWDRAYITDLYLGGLLTLSTGDLTLTTGDVIVTAGGITVTAGDITATAGAIEAGTTLTAGTGIVSTTGDIDAVAGVVDGNGGFQERGRTVKLGEWDDYTPVVSGGSSALGNGTITGRYSLAGKTCEYRVTFTLGSTSVIDGSLAISLPATAATHDVNQPLGSAIYTDTGTNVHSGTAVYKSTTTMGFIQSVGGVDATNPFTWTTSDILMARGTYEIA